MVKYTYYTIRVEEGFFMGTENDYLFDIMGVLFPIMFFGILGLFVFGILSSIFQWKRNNKQPRLKVPAKVVTKRMKMRGGESHSTSYFTTFEVESGDRMELEVEGGYYGQLVEGDEGMLSFQGTRFLEFNR